jgi:TRAP-type uncharacterized transport system substrate-binding protein
VVALAAAAWVAATGSEPPAKHVTLSAGVEGTSRALVARTFAREVVRHGVEVELVAEAGTHAELQSLAEGKVDFALVSSALRIDRQPAFARCRRSTSRPCTCS